MPETLKIDIYGSASGKRIGSVLKFSELRGLPKMGRGCF